MNYTNRIKKVQAYLETQNLDAFITMADVNYFYLSGFTGSSGAVIITKTKTILITDSRYTTQAKQQTDASCVEIIIHTEPLMTTITDILQKLDVKTCGFEPARLTVAQLTDLQSSGLTFKSCPNLVERIRYIKDETEIQLMQKAAQIGEEVYKDVLTYVESGMTEIDLAIRMEMTMRKLGASGPSFDTIVASGVRGALPHGTPTNKVINKGELVTLDFGVIYQGYCSDMTRTFAVAEIPSSQLIEMYETVLEANMAGCDAVAPNKTGKELDTIARNIITEAGFGEYFGHSLGHAVGIEVHEMPAISQKGLMPLESGMVITVEPGIYIEGIGGIRIEDTLLVTDQGHKNFMTLPKDLIIV